MVKLAALPAQEKMTILGYTQAQMQAFYKKGYEQALLDAMNATLPFGKTGAVIAAVIGALK